MMTMDANQNPSIVLETKNLDVQMPGRTLIKQLNWQVRQGERWCLIGRNGAGKSTLLRIIAGIQSTTSGEVLWQGKNTASYSSEDLAKVRAYAEQSPVAGIGLRAIDVVLAAQWPWHQTESISHQLAMDALKVCDVAHLSHAQWQTLSGGERQRVALAACFAQNTKALILDEPTSHLDVGHQVSLLSTLTERSQTCQQTVIASLHEIGLIGRGFTHALLLIEDGSYLAGSVVEVINPTNLEKSLGHPIVEAATTTGQIIYVPA
jgi:iron complex transport system ATP-binding protein